MMDAESQPSPNTSPVPTIQSLTVRLLMLGKEVGSIIGKEGKNVKRIREESGARINISDGSSPERIVTLVGNVDNVSAAFKMICTKFLEDIDYNGQNAFQSNGAWWTPLTIRLLVPASQCGCLIGKGGSKIKELRNITGASVQVASDALPNSTERTITLTGNFEPITRCFEYVCQMLAESPPKGPIIPYRPKAVSLNGPIAANGFLATGNPGVAPVVAPQTVLISGGPQAPFLLQSQFPLSPQAQADLTKLTQMQQTLNGSANSAAAATAQLMGAQQAAALQAMLTGSPMLNVNSGAVLRSVNGLSPSGPGGVSVVAAPPPPPVAALPPQHQQSHELTIPNDWVGCVIGRGGVKINEIRHLSGAVIKISPCEDGKKERSITITGSPEAVNVALYLIQTRISAELLANGGFCL
ncbi:poly(rC)-binding protein 3-like isoform X2 [Paramacrobiotus metropolitanus]|uniref:poly(rC)-binding protein 3-like isoform X2 n=1 Tax=Paramacrobiotus metropolitanus TaxID=2943436 RepID=UPI00244576A9|nr:poly(rC)-binding protein 3-like isoform X2 [Paramacrobiotus metropolitanus]